ITQAKAITRQVFGPLPTCTWSAQSNLALATNYTDIWLLPTESGWGLHITQQGSAMFAAWFTYDFTGAALSLTATLNSVSPGVYSGTLIKTSGPPFSAVPWDKNAVTRTQA